MTGKNFDGRQVRLAGVIDESSDVAVIVGVNAKGIPVLRKRSVCLHFA